MNTRILFPILAATAAIALVTTGCRRAAETATDVTRAVSTGRAGGAYEPVNTTKNALENQSKFVLMDYRAQRSVTSSGIAERVRDDGRLEVTANIRNRLERRIEVQIQCVFKDAQGFSTGDETPWQTLILTENAQESVPFVSLNDKARGYTIRVREAR
jgi:uncharacterized protein YcfL